MVALERGLFLTSEVIPYERDRGFFEIATLSSVRERPLLTKVLRVGIIWYQTINVLVLRVGSTNTAAM